MVEQEASLERSTTSVNPHADTQRELWYHQVAVTSVILAVLAALASMLGGRDATEAMIEQLQAANTWSQYHARGVKVAIQRAKQETLEHLKKTVPHKAESELRRTETEQDSLKTEATEKSERSERLLLRHERYSYAVTFFQVAIAVAGIAALTRRNTFWKASLLLGLAGLGFMVSSLFVKI